MHQRLISKEYHGLPLKVYLWGSIMALFAMINLFFILVKPQFDPFVILFFYSIPANTAISVFPHEPVIIYYGKYYNLFLIATFSSLSTLIAAYLDHTVFTPLLNHQKFTGYKQNKIYRKAILYFDKQPFWTIAVVAFSPIPFWPIKMLTFSRRYHLSKYLSAVLVGRFPRYYLLGLIGNVMLLPNWVIWVLFLAIFFAAIFDSIKSKIQNSSASLEVNKELRSKI